jgi:hypothetical protein
MKIRNLWKAPPEGTPPPMIHSELQALFGGPVRPGDFFHSSKLR